MGDFRGIVIDDEGDVTERFVKEGAFAEYGNIGDSPCADLKFCDQLIEPAISKWLKAEKKSAEESSAGSDITSIIPGQMDPKDIKTRQDHFKWPGVAGNPYYFAGAKMRKT